MKGLLIASVFFIASGVFALDLHLGGGAALGFTISDMGSDNSVLQYGDFSIKGQPIGFYYKEDMSLWYKTSSFDMGVFAFADLTYAELSVGYLGQVGTISEQHSSRHYYEEVNGVETGEESADYTQDDAKYGSSLIFIDLMGRYPFRKGKNINPFLAMGVGFNFTVGGGNYSDYERALFWNFNIKAGGGLDYTLPGGLFLRGELLFSCRLAFDQAGFFNWGRQMKNESEWKTFKMKNAGTYSLSPQIRIAVGYTIPLGAGK
ncbi:MAG: hypothetical protein LBO04_06215 [Spirochaetaceae bacterium]|jgi:hypothetical protein|nr:hypothetical protein [Spirochaetaceae bacterium]